MMDSFELLYPVGRNLVDIVNEGSRVIKIKVKVCSAILTRFCMFCTRPRYQVSVYWTIAMLIHVILVILLFCDFRSEGRHLALSAWDLLCYLIVALPWPST